MKVLCGREGGGRELSVMTEINVLKLFQAKPISSNIVMQTSAHSLQLCRSNSENVLLHAGYQEFEVCQKSWNFTSLQDFFHHLNCNYCKILELLRHSSSRIHARVDITRNWCDNKRQNKYLIFWKVFLLYIMCTIIWKYSSRLSTCVCYLTVYTW